jgi:hypothetical protein
LPLQHDRIWRGYTIPFAQRLVACLDHHGAGRGDVVWHP